METALAPSHIVQLHKECLAPICTADARVLILGSFPSVASLNAQQYYRHPRNAFWPILASALKFCLDAQYAVKCAYLIQNKIAVWDVLSSCQRQGSLDSAIRTDTLQCNDFATFFRTHPEIQCVLFNGGAARRFFERFARPTVQSERMPQLLTMPSTSPAFASMKFEQKYELWLLALREII